MKNTFTICIEIPMNEVIKYEFNKDTNTIFVDRVVSIPYPANYGFIPNTLSEDDDPIDVILYFPHKLYPNTYIEVRILGVLFTEDEKGKDPKIVAIPTFYMKDINSLHMIEKEWLEKVEIFFSEYKKTEKNKFVIIQGWGDENQALEIIKLSQIN